VPFDGIEFEPKLRWIDVISDVAFLVMDLASHERTDLAFASTCSCGTCSHSNYPSNLT
jgi:aminoglycoside phosphotransferase family enzyme